MGVRACRAAGRQAAGAGRGTRQTECARSAATLPGGPGHDTARPPTTRPRARGLGTACACRLGQLCQLGARATDLVFDLVFRLGSVSESLFGPGS